MEGSTTSAILSLAVIYYLISVIRAELLSAEECLKLGLNNAHLICSSCDLLDAYNLTALRANCNQCCSSDIQDTEKQIKKFPKARLEVCG